MRTLGTVEQLVEAAGAVVQQATAAAAAAAAAAVAAGSKQPQQPSVTPTPGSTEDRSRKIAAIQRILDASAPQPGFVQCRSADGECEAQYCSAACEAAAWRSGHCVLCVGSHPALSSFFDARNVTRNADLHVAAQMMAGFIAQLAAGSSSLTQQSSSQPQQSAGSLTQQSTDSDSAEAATAAAAQLWSQHTMFHAVPWSLVLAVQAVQQQQGMTSVPLRIVEAVNASITARDAADAKAEGLVSTIGDATAAESSAPAAAAAPAAAVAEPAQPAVDPSDRALFDALSASQLQYRAALAEPFALLRSALLSTPHLPASRVSSQWRRFISLPAFDLLAGANRLNCTMTQCTMALPPASSPMMQPPPMKARKLQEADLDAGGSEDDDGASPAAASSGSGSSGVPFLVRSLESLFLPLGLPLSCSRGLFVLHSKMNHACSAPEGTAAGAGAGGAGAGASAGSANARVENWQESDQIRWSSASVARAAQRTQQPPSHPSAASSGSSSSAANKKKAQKARKAAASRLARQDSERREEIEQLEEMAARAEKIAGASSAASATPTAGTSSAAAVSSAAAALSSSLPTASADPSSLLPPLPAVPSYLHSSQIVVRALRDLEPGEEVLIDYLPSQHALGSLDRREYLRTHYLFECRCSRCSAASARSGEPNSK